ncbi:MAG: HD domain-containing phosphohydrolase [Leptospirales bacterium]
MPNKLLFVDDERDFEVLIKQRLRKKIKEDNLELFFAYDGSHALKILEENKGIHVIFTDINMPKMDGLTLLSKINELPELRQTVIISAYGDMNNIRTSMNRGAFDFLTKPLNFEDMDITLEKVRSYVRKVLLEKEEKELLEKELDISQKEVIYKLAEIVEARSKETGNHVRRVANYSKVLALGYGLSEQEAEELKMASPIHDVGKIAIADAILCKPGKLTEEEFEKMKTHTTSGYEILQKSNRKIFQNAAIVAYEHHEKFDGSGYPRGLKGNKIHIYGRITAVADVYDALGSERVYKKVWPEEKIHKLFKEQSGKHFEPKLIDVFFESLEQLHEIKNMHKDVQTGASMSEL